MSVSWGSRNGQYSGKTAMYMDAICAVCVLIAGYALWALFT